MSCFRSSSIAFIIFFIIRSCLVNNALNWESNVSGHENGINFSLTDFELFASVDVLSEGLPDGLLVLGVKVWAFSILGCSSCSVISS